MSLFCDNGHCNCWQKRSLPEFLVHFWPKRFDHPFEGSRDSMAQAVEKVVREGGQTSMWTDRAIGTTSIMAGGLIWAACLGRHPLMAYVGKYPAMVRLLVWHMLREEGFAATFGPAKVVHPAIDVCGVRIRFYRDLGGLRGVSRTLDGARVRTTLHLIDQNDRLFPHYLREYAGLMVTPRDQEIVYRRTELVGL